jgi:outer membrane protein TolC
VTLILRNALTTAVLALMAVAVRAEPAPAAVATPAAAPADTTGTLSRCEGAALAASHVLDEGRASAASARAAADAAAAGLYPALGLSGSASYVTETMSIDIPTPLGARHIEFGDGSSTDLMLGVHAPLFRGGTLRAQSRAAQAQWRASMAELAADSLDLRLQVRRAFYAALGSQAVAEAARQGEARLQRHLADVQTSIAAGTATEEARLQVLARLRQTEQTTLKAQAAAAAWRYELARLVGQAGSQIVPAAELDSSLIRSSEGVRPWDERPALQALQERIAAADQSRRAAAGSFWPAVDIEGGWHYGRPGVNAVADEWMDYGTVAVNLRWTLFDFGGRGDRVRSLRAQTRALASARQELDDGLRTRLANARTQLDSAREQAERAAERLELERRRLQMTQDRWRAGHATESELLDSQDDVTIAGTDLAAARASLRLAEAELLAALGW